MKQDVKLKEFLSDTIDFSNIKIIHGDIDQQVNGFIVHLNLFRNEIEFWMNLLNKSININEKSFLKKPICIELFEYCCYLKWLKNILNDSVKEIRTLTHDRISVIKLNSNIKNTLKHSYNYLYNPRNKMAAHRYTKKNSKEFLTILEIMTIFNELNDEKLITIKDNLFRCHDQILDWLDMNKRYLILLKNY